jgi:hypothetical protein
MYRPNFCSECGLRIIRLHWHLWTSRRFCASCAKRLRKERLLLRTVVSIALLSIGLLGGRAARPVAPPLTVERSENSSLHSAHDLKNASAEKNEETASATANREDSRAKPQTSSTEEVVYICGARTKKGKPCSRRVHGPVRCWQHKGMPAILAEEKLVVKE